METLGNQFREEMRAELLQPEVEELFSVTAAPVQSVLTLNEAVELGATDGVFYSHYFFPSTVRQSSPEMHYEIWGDTLNPLNRLLSYQVYRGGAKTTLARLYTSWRVAYSFSRTIMYLGKSEGHAARSVGWLRRQVERNTVWAQAFGLVKGSKWTDTECEILSTLTKLTTWILGLGIEGAVRGINIDDWRPDTIVLDDVLSDENVATPDQRLKINELILGAVKESLAPATENPNATLLMLNTPLNKEDASSRTENDPEWTFRRYSCFTPESAGLPTEEQKSSWPDRWSDTTLQKEKLFAIRRNQLSIWLREKECKLIDPETSAFKEEWLRYYAKEAGEGPTVILPERGRRVLVIDPVPPPSEIQIAKGLRDKDYEVLMVVMRSVTIPIRYFCLDYKMNRGHDPSWTLAMFWTLVMAFNPQQIVVETVAYQRTLKWLIEEDMKRKGRYLPVKERPKAKRSKYDKIVDPLKGPASEGALYIHSSQATLRQQYVEYPNVNFDDVIECYAMGVEELTTGVIIDGDYESVDPGLQSKLPENWRRAP